MIVELKNNGVYTFSNFLNEEECRKYRELVYNPPSNATHFTNAGVFTPFNI